MARYPNTIANCKTTPEATVAATASAAWASRTDSVSFVMCILHVELILRGQVAPAAPAQQMEFLMECLAFLK
jgi:hypothetical protein